MTEFEYLLQNYLEGTDTGPERARLLALLRSRQYDDLMGDRIEEMLEIEWARQEEALPGHLRTLLEEDILRRTAAFRAGRIFTRQLVAAAAVLFGMVCVAAWFVLRGTGGSAPTGDPSGGREAWWKYPGTDKLVRWRDRRLITMPDGSKIWLKDGSELTYYSEAFGKTSRDVSLTGEAYFDIRRMSGVPFRVHSGKVTTTVLGTAFNIRASGQKDEVLVTVARGKVAVYNGEEAIGQLTRNEELRIEPEADRFEKRVTSAEKVTEWINDYLVFDNQSLDSTFRRLSGRFGVRFRPENERLLKCRVSAVFYEEENLKHILEVLGALRGFQATYSPDGTVKITGGDVCNESQ